MMANQQQQQQQSPLSMSPPLYGGASNYPLNPTVSSQQQQPKDRKMASAEQLVLELSNPDLRENALLDLSKKREIFQDLAPLLWNSFGTIAALLQDGTRTLLDVSSDLPDNELILQKHFIAMLSSVWRARSRLHRYSSMLSSYQSGFYSAGRFLTYSPHQNSGKFTRGPLKKMNLAVVGQNSKLVEAALQDESVSHQDDAILSSPREEALAMGEQLEITLELHTENEVPEIPLPSRVNLSVFEPHTPPSGNEPTGKKLLPESSCSIAENRFRVEFVRLVMLHIKKILTVNNDLREEMMNNRPSVYGKGRERDSDPKQIMTNTVLT